MIKRTLEISQQPVHLSVRQRQLVLRPRSNGNGTGHNGRQRRGVRSQSEQTSTLASIPCEDIGVLLVDQPAVTYSHSALTELLENNAAVVLCGKNHLPAGVLLPIGEHSEVLWRVRTQLSASKPTQKRLWQQIVRAKIRAQALNLAPETTARSKLLALARNVRSGDPDNVEAQAGRAYWSAWRDSLTLPSGEAANAVRFRRDADGPPPNNLLNYGYAVMRAAVARAIVAAGLFPTLGIKHASRSNAFCLADDLVEPLRAMVDEVVRSLVRKGESELTPKAKRALLSLLAAPMQTGDQTGPLMVNLHRYVASFIKCIEGSDRTLEIPVRRSESAIGEPDDPPEG